MLIQIFLHTPAYVWGLFAGLIGLGLLQSRNRRVAPQLLLALPLVLLGLGLWTMAPRCATQPLVGLLLLAALITGALLGRRMTPPAGTRWLAEQHRLHLPGSWAPMALILLIFSLRYWVGAGTALHPEWRSLLPVQLPLALVFGTLAGLALGRTLRFIRLTRPSGAATIPTHVRSLCV